MTDVLQQVVEAFIKVKSELQKSNKDLRRWQKAYRTISARRRKLEEENEKLKKWCEGFNALDVVEENQKLKELLKEWIHYYPIVLYKHEDTLKTKDIIELYDRTREVLK